MKNSDSISESTDKGEVSMASKDLGTVLKYGNHPVRVGLVEGELMFCLNDLLRAVGHGNTNVTNSLRKIPDSLYFKVSVVDIDGTPINAKAIGITEEGALMALSRLYKIDLTQVLRLYRWMRKVDKDKLKKGA